MADSVRSTRQVFIVGMNGSGTTMLLDCLAGHSLLYGFRGETKVLPYFIQHESDYGDLLDEVRLQKLCVDLKAAIGRQRWPAAADPSSLVNSHPRPRTSAQVFDALLAALAANEGKSIWCEKTPMYVHHMETLATHFPNALFIHVIRDGRDCAASFHRRWKFHPVRTAYRWKRAVRGGRAARGVLGARYFEVYYEQLTSCPEATLTDLCKFIGVPFEADILSPARLRPQMTGSSASKIAHNKRRADRYFNKATLRDIEHVAGRQLLECGYQPENSAGDFDPPSWQLRWWEFLDDSRRFVSAVRRAASFPRGEGVNFLARRLRAAIRQKRTLD